MENQKFIKGARLLLFFMYVLLGACSVQKRNLDLEFDRIPSFSKGIKGILGIKSVLNLVTCSKADIHNFLCISALR